MRAQDLLILGVIELSWEETASTVPPAIGRNETALSWSQHATVGLEIRFTP